MTTQSKFAALKQYTDSIGSVYGTEDFAIYLYAIVKMMKPKNVVELGTGLGSTALWAGLALEENGFGSLYTVDDGSEWDRLSIYVKSLVGNYYRDDYASFINNLITSFNLENIHLLNEKISVININEPIDILFTDFAHSVFDIVNLLAGYLPLMNNYSKIYIDSASTNYASYSALEELVSLLNQGKVPVSMQEVARSKIDISNSKFHLEHIIENKNRSQNSTACITIMPADIFCYPRVGIRGV